MNYKDQQHLFQMLAGSFLTGTSYHEYCFFLYESLDKAIQQGGKDGKKIAKGMKTLLAYTNENHQRSEKHLKMIGDFLKREPSTYAMALEEVDRIEGVIYDMLTLSPTGQERVKGLIAKIKKDQSEIDFWKQLEEEQKALSKNEPTTTNTQAIS